MTDLEIAITKTEQRRRQRVYIKTDRNGTKYYSQPKSCPRCGGAGGSSMWAYTGWNCYECGGSGTLGTEIVKEYTPEYQAKLDARREAKAEAARRVWEAEEAKREAERKEREAEAAKRKAEAEAAEMARKAISQHFGEVGKRYELKLTYNFSASFEVQSFSGFGMETMFIHNFKDENGNVFIWKTSKGVALENGVQVSVKGTVKEHNEYKDEKQTVLTRCSITK